MIQGMNHFTVTAADRDRTARIAAHSGLAGADGLSGGGGRPPPS